MFFTPLNLLIILPIALLEDSESTFLFGIITHIQNTAHKAKKRHRCTKIKVPEIYKTIDLFIFFTDQTSS